MKITKLLKGQRFSAQTVVRRDDELVYRERTFTASLDHDIELDFIDPRDGKPAQARVRVLVHYPQTYWRPGFTIPGVDLVVQDSIQLIDETVPA